MLGYVQEIESPRIEVQLSRDDIVAARTLDAARVVVQGSSDRAAGCSLELLHDENRAIGTADRARGRRTYGRTNAVTHTA